ncbi:hypothetical protein OCL90_14795, partial [Enterococcus faecalis]|nr:hypothetical protein [Enterococcus faecalis]
PPRVPTVLLRSTLVNSDESAPLIQEAIWMNLPAVKNNQVHTYDKESSWSYNGPIANTLVCSCCLLLHFF